MEKLKHDWLTEGLIDFEYKKYVLLAYLQDVKKNFSHTKLYPFLSEVIFHYNNLKKIKDDKELIYESFPKSISKADFRKLKLNYKKVVSEDEIVKLLEEIISYALQQFGKTIEEGREVFDFVRENMEIERVGLTPIYVNEGYILVNVDARRDVMVYRYSSSVFESANEQYRGISTTFIGQDFTDLSRTFETIKRDLVKRYTDLPNPNTYKVISKLKFPVLETVLPIAKRLVMKEISVSTS